MYFENTLGNKKIQNLLIQEVSVNRIPHAQLFVGPEGCFKLPMAIAFATYLFCKNKGPHESCKDCEDCAKMSKLTHPDLHFFFPTIKTEKEEKKSKSKDGFSVFQQTLLNNPSMNMRDWQMKLKSENKTISIRTRDILEIKNISNLRSYGGGYKVFIVWCAETMNVQASNTFLKSLEEPSDNTIFILISHRPLELLPTITSRLQIKRFQKIESSVLLNHFKKINPDLNKKSILNYISEFSHNYNEIKNCLEAGPQLNPLENMFVSWVRLAFLSANPRAKLKNAENNNKDAVIPLLIDWCNDMGKQEKHTQLEFIQMTIGVFRHVFLLNYNFANSKYDNLNDLGFSLNQFSKYITRNNVLEIVSLLDTSHSSLIRYANSKLLFLDLSFCLGNLLRKN